MLLCLPWTSLLLILLLAYSNSTAMSGINAKKALRNKIKAALKVLDDPYVESASAVILEKRPTQKINNSPIF
jgi:hypothetical protein